MASSRVQNMKPEYSCEATKMRFQGPQSSANAEGDRHSVETIWATEISSLRMDRSPFRQAARAH